MLYSKEKLKGIKKCIIKSFAFYYNKYRNYSIAQSQQTLAVYKNTKERNYRGPKVKDLRDIKTNS